MFKFIINLHQFDEGASVGTADAEVSDDGLQAENITNDTEVSDSDDNSIAKSEETSKPSFEELIKGEYKDDYNKKMNSVVRSRLKNAKETQAKLDSWNPVRDALVSHYGLDANAEPEDILNAIYDDDRLYEDEALEKGIPVTELKRMKRMESENETMRKMIEQESMRKEYEERMMGFFQEAEELKQFYPDFDFEYESLNEETGELFSTLLKDGIPMKNAYEVTHPEIQVQMMKVVADKTAEKVANGIKANKNRPRELGNSGFTGTQARLDPSKLSGSEIDDLIARAAKGEKIVF